MAPKRELSLDQIQKIRALRDKLPAAEAKKHFGIGSTRLYKIWRDESTELPGGGPLEPAQAGPQSLLSSRAAAPTVEDIYNRLGRLESHAAQATGRPLEPAQAGPQSLLPSRVAAPTIEDFYNRLGRLESRAEQATGLLVEVLEQLAQLDDPLDELQEEIEETAEEVQATRDEQTETRMDLREMAKTAQTWTYICLAAFFAWRVAAKTWNQCAPKPSALPGTPVESDKRPQDGQQSAVGHDKQENATPGQPSYME